VNRSRTLRPDKHTLAGIVIVLAAASLIALTWFGTFNAIGAQRAETSARIASTVANQAQAFSEQIGRHILALDQTLRGMRRAWEANPGQFNLESRRGDSLVLNGISRDMLLVDERGIIRQSSVPEAVGQSAGDRDFFNFARAHQTEPNGLHPDTLFIGGAAIDAIMRQWHLNVAQWLHRSDGAFAGVIAADYRVSAIQDAFRQASLGTGGIVLLIGLNDGRVRASVGPTEVDPNAAVAGTPMLAAMLTNADGLWSGSSATDAVRRIHAYRRLPDRDLLVVVGMDDREAMRSADMWQREATIFAACITLLLLIVGGILLFVTHQARERGLALAEESALLAAANAQLEVAKAHADAKTEQLEATLAGMTDGIAMMDGQYCLVEWNARFPDLAGIPSGLLRVGLPMEDILRAQARSGQFGDVDTEAETTRRMVILRAGRFGTTERTRPDGRTLELRRNRLPDGGFVTLYSDITERKIAENTLREAREMAEAANAAKSRFVAIVSHEIRTPLNALLNTLRLLADGELGSSQRALVQMASQSGDALSGLINDILDMSRMEAGYLPLRESVFALHPMLEGALGMFSGQARDAGIALKLSIAADVPAQLSTDPGRLRQVLLNLLSNAVKFARGGDVWLLVERDHDTGSDNSGPRTPGLRIPGLRIPGLRIPGLRIMVRDHGPIIQPEDRTRLFRPFTRLERPEGDDPAGTGLGLAICHHLVTLMGGEIGCDVWSGSDPLATHDSADFPPTGNSFWLTLPASVLPSASSQPAFDVDEPPHPLPSAAASLPRRPLPRTRVLLVEDVPANQVVTATLLRRVGHMVDVVSNGEAAIRAVKQVPYDLVFMDNFMPGMSGLEAAQRIRSLSGVARTVPIIALTANVGPEDEANFRAAGMDGIQDKPVSLPELLSVLAKHCWPGHAAGAAPQPPAMMTNGRALAPSPILSMERIRELRGNIPADLLAKLLEECLTDLQTRMPPFRKALESGRDTEIVAQAHTMAGVAAGYGMAALELHLRSIMDASSAGNTRPRATAFDETVAELSRATAALHEVMKNEMA
jgi:signal transduction histidine kinase/CheY-like chemotaxis protein